MTPAVCVIWRTHKTPEQPSHPDHKPLHTHACTHTRTHTHSPVCLQALVRDLLNTQLHVHTHIHTLSSFIQAGQLFVHSSPPPEALRETHLFSLLSGCKPLFAVLFSFFAVFHYEVFCSFYVTMLHHSYASLPL